MARVFVTGGTGFIGGHLVEALVARGDHVRCLARPKSDTSLLKAAGAEIVPGDVSDSEAIARGVAGADEVYHLAGLTLGVSVRALHEANALGAERVAAACARQATPPVMVLVSSLAAAGPARPGLIRRPTDPPCPISNYGRSKRAGELCVARFARQVPISVVRPGVVFGPRGRAILPVFQMIQRTGFHIVPFYNPPLLSFIDARDLVTMLLRSAERGERIAVDAAATDAPGRGYYFAAVPEHLNWKQLGLSIGQAMDGRPVTIFYAPEPLPWIVASLSETLIRLRVSPADLTIDKIREAAAPSWACCGESAWRQLDCQPAYSLHDRLRQSVEWYREMKWM
ncbi:MAG: NAD-dependent epimerase/dehydratase family protein [Pirellulaceae bacterium]